jgi:hypothetical protein
VVELVRSPRRRRRLIRVGAVVLVGGVVALVAFLLPSTNGNVKSRFSNAPVQRVTVEREVPVTAERRRQVDGLFDAFVPAAMERRDPGAAYDLVTPSFRGGTTRRDWQEGRLPVYPYQARGRTFHGWTVDLSYPRSMSLELDLQPRAAKDNPISVNVDLKLVRGRWLIDSFYPREAYTARANPKPKPSARTGTTEAAPPPSALPKSHATATWALLAAILVIVVGTPLSIVGVSTYRARRARKRYRSA